MKHEIAINREYIKGINTLSGTSMHALQSAKNAVQGMIDNSNEYPCTLIKLFGLFGQLERFHSPKEVGKKMDSTFEWCASACCKTVGTWEQWVQTTMIQESRLCVDGAKEIERFPAQKVMVGSNKQDRLHIEWDSGRQEGYKHSVTTRYMNIDSFHDAFPVPPNFLMALPPGYLALDGYTIQTGDSLANVDDTFKWFDAAYTKKWIRILIYELDDVTYVCAINEKHFLDALSGFTSHHLTIMENEESSPDKGIHHLVGSIRMDGEFEGKRRTAVLKTAKISDETIATLMGAI